MKVRLYRGPHADKVLMLNDHETIVQFAEAPEINWSEMNKHPGKSIGLNKVTYVRTRHTHPDGSVYFEWDKPKGTKTGKRRKPKRKPVIQSQMPGIYITGGTMTTTSLTTPYSTSTP